MKLLVFPLISHASLSSGISVVRSRTQTLLLLRPAKLTLSKNPFTTSLRRGHAQTGVHDD